MPSVITRLLARSTYRPAQIAQATQIAPFAQVYLALTKCQEALLRLADPQISLAAFKQRFKSFAEGYFSTNAFAVAEPAVQGNVVAITTTLSTPVERYAGQGPLYLNVQSTTPFAQFGTLDRWTINRPVRAIYSMDQAAYAITNSGGYPAIGKGNGIVPIEGDEWTATATLSLDSTSNQSVYQQTTAGAAGVRLSLTGDANTGLEWNTPTDTTEQLHQAFMIGANKYYNPIIQFNVSVAQNSFGKAYAFVLMHRGQQVPVDTSDSEWWSVCIDADKSTIEFFDCQGNTSSPFVTSEPVATFGLTRDCTYQCAIQLTSDGRVSQYFYNERVFQTADSTGNDTVINVRCAAGFVSNGPCQINVGAMLLAQNQIVVGKQIEYQDTFYAQPQDSQENSFTVRVMRIGGDSINDDITVFGPVTRTFRVEAPVME